MAVEAVFLFGLHLPAAARPNIVFIMADDLGAAHLGCYGQKLVGTPNIDRLAAEGMKFTQVYSGCSLCAPCRSVLMTGKHAGHTSVRANIGGVPLLDEDITVAEVLKEAGYATGGFGKWGLGDAETSGVPHKQGFDEFFGYLNQFHAHFFYPPYLWRNEEKFPLPGNNGGPQGESGTQRETYSHDVISRKALDFIRRHKDEPFFCYVPFTIPHVEILAPEDSVRPYRGKFPEIPFLDPKKHYADQPEPRAVFAGMINHLDKSVGRIVGLLKELEIDENTILFFTSDNGPQIGAGTDPQFFNAAGELRGFKGDLYEGGIRVPMIVRWPGKIEAGALNDHLWYFPDVMPTLAELAEATDKLPEDIDGISVAPTLLGRSQIAHEALYWEIDKVKYTADERVRGHLVPGEYKQAARMGKWKAVRQSPGEPLELYQLDDDPAEIHDVSMRHPEIVKMLEDYLKSARTEPREQADPARPEGWKYR